MDITVLENKLKEVIDHIDDVENSNPNWLDNVNDEYLYSAQNLLHYLALRSLDMKAIQFGLISFGISSLGTSPGYVRENISRSLDLLKLMQGKTPGMDLTRASSGFENGNELLRVRSNSLFRSDLTKTRTKIMVTMPDEATHNVMLLEHFLKAGMDIARINLSHGDYTIWDQMLDNIIDASTRESRKASVYMDLPGPKIRVDNIFQIQENNKEHNQVETTSLLMGDQLELIKETEFRKLRFFDKIKKTVVTVLLPQIIDDMQMGHRIFFDDGAIEGMVISKSSMGAVIEITKVTKKKLRTGKGINLPDTSLSLPSLTEDDLALLPYACKNADIIGYSFVRNSKDVRSLYSNLSTIDNNDVGVILKIETREAFENLPAILLEAMRRPRIGVMIARGDLAVEIGFERISEVKNQIMTICEAAHVPVIWATQVLENMAKKGMATRAEISDVVLSGKAECVMLNKGPYMHDTITVLKNILERMEGHYSKNKNSLRALGVAKKNLKSIQSANVL